LIFNNIITSNELEGVIPYEADVEYNNIWDNDPDYEDNIPAGQYNISTNPLFIDTINNDYNISLYSPCVDAGNPDPQYNDNDGTRNDMGAFPTTSCCVIRGDVAIPVDGFVLVSDLVFLVDYIFKSGESPICPAHGDCAFPVDGKIFVDDLTYLVNYIFKGGPAPPECP